MLAASSASVQRQRIPANVVLSPSWWHRHYGISFGEAFYMDRAQRIHDDGVMRRALHERFGIGSPDDAPRPVIGSCFIAGGFVVPALLGVPIRFTGDQAAWPVAQQLDRERIMGLRVPALEETWPMNELIRQMDELEDEFGFVSGDLNTGGLINTALELRGQQFFIDLMEDPELSDHLLEVVGRTQAAVAECVKRRTGTCAVATNLSVLDVDPALYLTSNCSVQMISPALYERRVLEHERPLAERLRPYGIHHCGDNLQLFARAYATLRPVFIDTGWGSDVARCAAELPDAFLNLRLSPVGLLQCGAAEIYEDAISLLRASGRRERVGVCAINLDGGTPDENVRALLQAAADYEKETEQ